MFLAFAAIVALMLGWQLHSRKAAVVSGLFIGAIGFGFWSISVLSWRHEAGLETPLLSVAISAIAQVAGAVLASIACHWVGHRMARKRR